MVLRHKALIEVGVERILVLIKILILVEAGVLKIRILIEILIKPLPLQICICIVYCAFSNICTAAI